MNLKKFTKWSAIATVAVGLPGAYAGLKTAAPPRLNALHRIGFHADAAYTAVVSDPRIDTIKDAAKIIGAISYLEAAAADGFHIAVNLALPDRPAATPPYRQRISSLPPRLG